MQQNNLNLGSIGQKLESARQRKGLTISEIGRETKILGKFINAMESDNFEALSAPVYAKSFIRMYAQYLGLDPQPLIDDYLSIHAPNQKRPHEESKNPLNDAEKPPEEPQTSSAENIKKIRPVNPSSSFIKPQTYAPNHTKTIVISTVSILIILLFIFTVKQCSDDEETQPAPAAGVTQLKRTSLIETVPDAYLTDSENIDIDLNKK